MAKMKKFGDLEPKDRIYTYDPVEGGNSEYIIKEVKRRTGRQSHLMDIWVYDLLTTTNVDNIHVVNVAEELQKPINFRHYIVPTYATSQIGRKPDGSYVAIFTDSEERQKWRGPLN